MTPKKQSLVLPMVFLGLFLALVVAMATAVYRHYLGHRTRIMNDKYDELAAVADLKVDQIVTWRGERLEKDLLLLNNPFFAEAAARFLSHPESASLRKNLSVWLSPIRENRCYHSIVLLDTALAERVSFGAENKPVGKLTRALAAEALRSGRTIISDFHYGDAISRIHLDVLVPLAVRRAGASAPVGVVLVRLDPSHELNPLIQSWPTPSPSAETLLVRREGNDVLFLNELRHWKGTALSLRMPLTKKELPAVQAVLGREGNFQGKDYRGVPVLSVTRKIPGAPWFLVAKIDTAEIIAPLRREAWVAGAISVLLILLAGTGFGLIWRHSSARSFKKLYQEERAHHALAERIECLMRYAHDSILLFGESSRIIEANEKALEIYGYSREEMLGRPVTELLSPAAAAGSEEKNRRIREKGGMVFESVHRRKDGTLFPVECSVSHIRIGNEGYYQAISRDVGERKAAEEQVRLNEARLQSLYNISQYRAANVQDLLDFSLAEALRLTSSTFGYIYFYDEEKREFTLNSWSNEVMEECSVVEPQTTYALDKTGIWGEVVRQRRPILVNDFQGCNPLKKGYPPGHVELLSYLSIPVFFGEKIVAVVGVANKGGAYDETDIRQLTLLSDSVWKYVERKNIEEELIRLNVQLEERVLERTADLEAFTYTVSHDLRAPLRAIIGFSGILLEEYSGVLDAEGRRLLDVVIGNTKRMGQLIDDLLSFSRVGRSELSRRPIDMTALARSVCTEVLTEETREKIRCRVETLPEAEGDFSLLRQVWVNLLSNAVKFTRPKDNGIIEVGSLPGDGETVYYVKDTGVGFESRYSHKLFAIFQRLHSSAEFEGTGVGLAIVQRIIERHGGRVWAEGKQGEGATFYFSLPGNGVEP